MTPRKEYHSVGRGRRKGDTRTVWGMIPEPIGDRVKKCRLRRGWSQSDLAAFSGTTLNGIASLERNETIDPHSSTIILLAKVFGVPTDYLLGVEPEAPIIPGWTTPEAAAKGPKIHPPGAPLPGELPAATHRKQRVIEEAHGTTVMDEGEKDVE